MQPEALVLMAIFRDLLLANANLFGEAAGLSGDARRRGARLSQSAIRLPSGAELLIRAYQDLYLRSAPRPAPGR